MEFGFYPLNIRNIKVFKQENHDQLYITGRWEELWEMASKEEDWWQSKLKDDMIVLAWMIQ